MAAQTQEFCVLPSRERLPVLQMDPTVSRPPPWTREIYLSSYAEPLFVQPQPEPEQQASRLEARNPSCTDIRAVPTYGPYHLQLVLQRFEQLCLLLRDRMQIDACNCVLLALSPAK